MSRYTPIEEDARFSESVLWKLQETAYQQFGPEAWTEKGVPFYLTSNPFTARQYACLAIAYLRDCVKEERIDYTAPIYLFDLGAGTGRFAYQFLRFFRPMLSTLFPDVQIKYVMTDIVESNFTFWETHSYLKPGFAEGVLDSAYYFHSQKEALFLRNEKIDLEEFTNPIVLIGNYFFDTIPQDLFRVKDGTLQEGRVSLKAEGEWACYDNPKIISKLETNYSYRSVVDPRDYYVEKPLAAAVLQDYSETFDGTTFLFPIGAFDALDFFRMRSKKGFFLLAGDQGVSTEAQVRTSGEPKIDKHGTFSIAVSYHAIASYFQHAGGKALLPRDSDPLFVVIAAEMGLAASGELEVVFEQTFNYFEPKDYWNSVAFAEKDMKSLSLEYLLLLIKFGCYDPVNFAAFFEHIVAQLPEASEKTKKQLLNMLYPLWEAFFPVSAGEGTFVMNLGVIAFELGAYRKALDFFLKAEAIMGEEPLLYQNMAACFRRLGMHADALRCTAKIKQK